jgi:hypothetical protein
VYIQRLHLGAALSPAGVSEKQEARAANCECRRTSLSLLRIDSVSDLLPDLGPLRSFRREPAVRPTHTAGWPRLWCRGRAPNGVAERVPGWTVVGFASRTLLPRIGPASHTVTGHCSASRGSDAPASWGITPFTGRCITLGDSNPDRFSALFRCHSFRVASSLAAGFYRARHRLLRTAFERPDSVTRSFSNIVESCALDDITQPITPRRCAYSTFVLFDRGKTADGASVPVQFSSHVSRRDNRRRACQIGRFDHVT